MNKITYANKVDTRTTTDPEINKVTASTLNEVKTIVNETVDEVLSNINDISTNATDISTNVTNISTNATDIGQTVKITGNQTIAGIKAFTDDVTATTQANAINNTTVATTAYVKNLIGEIPAGLSFESTWNADTNTPNLSTATPNNGQFWIVSVNGATDLSGITDWKVGDWAIYVVNGAGANGWQKVDNSSVLDGQGTGQKVALWSGSGDSNTLTNSPITVSGNDATFTGTITVEGTGDSSFSGNVGIGTNTPVAKLDVSGVTKTDSILINATSPIASSIVTLNKASTSTGTDVGQFYDITKENTTDSATSVIYGIVNKVDSISNFENGSIISVNNVSTVTGAGDVENVYPCLNQASVKGTGTVDFAIGSFNESELNNASGTVNNLWGTHTEVVLTAGTAGEITLLSFDFDQSAGTTITGDFQYINIKNEQPIDSSISGTARALNIESELPSFFAGSIGIGTNSPDAKLEVSGDNGTAIRITIPQSSPVVGDVLSSFETFSNDTSGGIIPSVRTSISTIAEDAYGRKVGLTLNTSGADGENLERVRVDGLGNVGIGTDTPGEKLEVNGNIRLGNSASLLWGSNNLTLKTASASTIGVFSLAPNSNGTVHAPRFQMLNASSAVGVSIRTDANSYFNGGNVGIGTDSPDAKLNIKGSVSTALTGTVSVTIATTAVVGVGTLFTTELEVGNAIKIGAEIFTVATITDALNLTIDSAHVAGASAVTAYSDSTLFNVDNGNDVNLLTVDKSGSATFASSVSATDGNFSGDINFSSDARIKTSGASASSDTMYLQNDITGITSHLNMGVGSSDFRLFVDGEATFGSSVNASNGNFSGNVGVGTTTPKSKLQVDGGIQMADDTDTASSDKVGTLKYRISGNNSYVDMCMQTGAATYAWINIVQNNW